MRTKLIFLLLLGTFSVHSTLSAQTKLSYSMTVQPENKVENAALIEASFGQATTQSRVLKWEKNGPGYHYKIRLSDKKVSLRYTGRAIQVERKIKALRKKLIR
ncbi:MAG: hypothetical protein ACPG8F_07860 [Flavobacteriaceae bacterium]